MTSPAAKVKYSSTKILQQRESQEAEKRVHPPRRWREVALSVSLSLQVLAAVPPVECITQLSLEASGSGWILAEIGPSEQLQDQVSV